MTEQAKHPAVQKAPTGVDLLGGFIIATFLFPFIAMLLWNAVVPDLFGLPALQYWQAFLLRLTVSFLTH